MRLVLAGADGAPLREQLTDLGYQVVAAGDGQVQGVMDLCRRAAPDMAILADLDQAAALSVERPSMPIVLTAVSPLDGEQLLRALRIGVCDVWTMPMERQEVAERLAQISRRRRASASDAETRLSGFLADIERDQRAGRYIQMGMLPPNPMAIDGFRFQHHILPSLILSGDFVDYFRLGDGHFCFYAADVSGHGASSAFVTVLLKNFSRRLRREYRPSMLGEPGEVLQWLNRELLEQKIDKHVALLLGIGDLATGVIRLVNGGHYPPAIVVSDGSSAFVEQRGKPVGLFDQVEYDCRAIDLAGGDRLVLFSDGIIDAMGPGGLAEKEVRLLAVARDGSTVEEMWALLQPSFPDDVKPDDMTCLVVQREC